MNKKNQKRLALKGEVILKISGFENVHQITLHSMISVQTGYKYLQDSRNVKSLDLKVLASLLMDGAGLTPNQVLEMKIGDLFELVDSPELKK